MKNVELKYTIYRKIVGGANAPLAPPLATALWYELSAIISNLSTVHQAEMIIYSLRVVLQDTVMNILFFN